MTVIVDAKKFDRIWTVTAGFFCLLALVFTIIAIRTSSWSINEYAPNGEVQWHGLFYKCSRLECAYYYNNNFAVILITIVGAVFLLIATLFIFLMGVHSFPRRHFYLTPTIAFISALLLLSGLAMYARRSLINGISSRLMITATVLAFTSFAIVMFVAGRYSVFYQRNPTDFHYTKTENSDTMNKVEEQQRIETGQN